MKILMLTPYLPYPPASGGQIRTYNLLKHLSVDHEISLVCLYKNQQELQYAEKLKPFCKEVFLCKRPEKPWELRTILTSITSALPFLIVRNYSTEAAKRVKALLNERSFDVIHAETFYIMPHIPQTKVPILLVEQTLEYRVYKHFIAKLPWFLHHPLRLDTFKLKVWERHYWNKAQLVAAVSEADAKAIHELAPSISPVVIANGASDDMFVHNPLSKQGQPPHLLFVGNFSWLQNTEAAEYLTQHIYPLIHAQSPEALITIAGQNIPPRLLQIKQPGIRYVSLEQSNNERVKQLYTEATIFVAPIYGPGGTRLKILTAMATHLPVITTATGAQGLSLSPGESVLLAESPSEFASQISLLIHNPQKAKEISEHAYQIAKDQFSWQSITRTLVQSYQSLQPARG